MQPAIQNESHSQIVEGVSTLEQLARPAIDLVAFEALSADSRIFQAIKDVFLSNPLEVAEVTNEVEASRRPHPQIGELSGDFPSVASLILKSKIDARIEELALAA